MASPLNSHFPLKTLLLQLKLTIAEFAQEAHELNAMVFIGKCLTHELGCLTVGITWLLVKFCSERRISKHLTG